jgi:lysophospholipase L1-like esterase
MLDLAFVRTFIETHLPFLPPLEFVFLWMYVLHFVFLYMTYHALRMLTRILINKGLAFLRKPFSTPEDRPYKILFLGDSTAVGTGAERDEDTLAGRLARDFPHAQIINKAVNGSRIIDIPKQLETLTDHTFNLIIVSSGGNDVWHMSRTKKIESTLSEIFPKLQAMSPKRVFFLTYNNISKGPLFPSWISWLLHMQAMRVEATIMTCAKTHHVPTIRLFEDTFENPFLKTPEKLFAADGMHPNSEGYRMWYNHMWRKMMEEGFHT